MKRALLGAIVAGVLFLGTAPANAGTINFTANLAGANEVPPSASPGIGSAILSLDDVAQTLSVSLVFSGLTAGDTAAHIHCCAPLGTKLVCSMRSTLLLRECCERISPGLRSAAMYAT